MKIYNSYQMIAGANKLAFFYSVKLLLARHNTATAEPKTSILVVWLSTLQWFPGSSIGTAFGVLFDLTQLLQQ